MATMLTNEEDLETVSEEQIQDSIEWIRKTYPDYRAVGPAHHTLAWWAAAWGYVSGLYRIGELDEGNWKKVLQDLSKKHPGLFDDPSGLPDFLGLGHTCQEQH